MTGRTGLGRGLGALIPTGASVMEELPTASVVPNPRQPRQAFDDEAISDLAASIRQVGILQPVVVRPTGDGSGSAQSGTMNAVVRVTLSSATGPENRMVTRGLTLQPSNSLSNRTSSQPAASAPQSGSGRAMRRPVAWPGSGTVSWSEGTSDSTWAAAAGRAGTQATPATASESASASRAARRRAEGGTGLSEAAGARAAAVAAGAAPGPARGDAARAAARADRPRR